MVRPVKLSNNKKRKIIQLLSLAEQALHNGNSAACRDNCDAIEALYPHHPDSLHMRGLLSLQLGLTEQAINQLRQASDAAPARADIIAGLGNAQLQAGNIDTATNCYQQALQIDAGDITSHLGLSGALMAQERYSEARELLEHIKKRKPGNSSIRMGLFHVYHALNQHETACSQLQAIIKRDANNAEAHYGLSILAIEQGKLDTAQHHARLALESNPYHADAWLVWVDLHRSDESGHEIEAMQNILQQCPEYSDARMKMSFALAKAHDDLGNHDIAFSMLKEANKIRHKHSTFDTAAAISELNLIIDSYSASTLAKPTQKEHNPCLFVVGMPRSGTTLLEQILASHPDVTALGENSHLQAAINELTEPGLRPSQLNALPIEQCIKIGENYLKRIQQHSDSGICYCDKTLSHINLLGLIHKALPQARFVHLQRHPIDTCLSIYKNNLQGTHFGYGSDLKELADYYATYLCLMTHWKKTLPGDLFHDMRYEQLIKNQETQVQALLKFCKLEWNESCMHFQQAEHAVKTASAIQVRQPLSTRSIGIWQHYKKHLGELQKLCQSD